MMMDVESTSEAGKSPTMGLKVRRAEIMEQIGKTNRIFAES